MIKGNWSFDDGREFTQREISSGGKVAIVGETIKNELVGEADPIGQTIRVNKMHVKTIGILKEKDENPFGRDQDDMILIPVKTVSTRVFR